MLAGIATDYAFGLGYMLLAGIAYLVRDWRKLQLAISSPGFLLIFYIWWGSSSASELSSRCVFTPVHWGVLVVSSVPADVLSVVPCRLPCFSLSPVRVLPHSARWLLAKDRREEAIALLRKAALVNGRVLPPTLEVRLGVIVTFFS